MRNNPRTCPAAEIMPDDPATPLELREIFGRAAPLEVDLGCGDGNFLTALAQAAPERDFLGVDRMAGRVRAACRKIGDLQLENARVLRAEILPVLMQLLPPDSVDVFYLMFPDPWPKRRHHSRRAFNEDFLGAIARVLRPGGVLRVATDDAEYFARMQQAVPRAADLMLLREPAPLPATTFEQRFRAQGLGIYRLALRKS